mgnify:CR=1 FL=1
MKDQDYELLSQYLDGELPTKETAQLEQRLGADSELRITLASMRSIDSAVKASYRNSGQAPAHIGAMLQGEESNVVAFPRRSRAAASWQYAVAATLVAAAGLLLVPDMNRSSEALLSAALDEASSRASGWETLEDGRKLRPVLSFPDKSGTWCREYLVTDAEGAQRGVACRDDKGWNTVVIAATEITPNDDQLYRPAGADDDSSVAKYISENAADIAASAQQESELIASDWQ